MLWQLTFKLLISNSLLRLQRIHLASYVRAQHPNSSMNSNYITPLMPMGGNIWTQHQILFPFDPSIAGQADLQQVPVDFSGHAAGQMIEERYRCDAGGTVTVSIRNSVAGYERQWPLARWSVQSTELSPVRRRGSRGSTAKGRGA